MEWKSNDELREVSGQAAAKIIEMLNKEGTFIPNPQYYPYGPANIIIDSMRTHAEDFLILSPQKIIEEFERMQDIARGLSAERSTDVIDAFRTIDYSVQDWRGDGAEAFQRQMSRVQAFVAQQSYYAQQMVRSLGVLLGVAVQGRSDFHALASAAITQADKAINEQDEEETKFAIGVGANLVTMLLSTAGGPGALLGASTSAFINVTASGLQMSISGGHSEDVLGSFNAGRERLVNHYKEGIDGAKNIIGQANHELGREPNELFEPLPTSIDIYSPNFSYGSFASESRGIDQFERSVNAERETLKPGPDDPPGENTPIRRRLGG